VDEALIDAYGRTAFVADTPRGRLTLRVGARSPELDDLLLSAGASSWAFVTAWNPRSVRASDHENIRRGRELGRIVAERGLVAYPGAGIGDDRTWPPEPSLLILGIGHAEAVELGRRFGQLAIVYGERGGCAELVLCEEDEPEQLRQ
jgi:hypothetical protein